MSGCVGREEILEGVVAPERIHDDIEDISGRFIAAVGREGLPVDVVVVDLCTVWVMVWGSVAPCVTPIALAARLGVTGMLRPFITHVVKGRAGTDTACDCSRPLFTSNELQRIGLFPNAVTGCWIFLNLVLWSMSFACALFYPS